MGNAHHSGLRRKKYEVPATYIVGTTPSPLPCNFLLKVDMKTAGINERLLWTVSESMNGRMIAHQAKHDGNYDASIRTCDPVGWCAIDKKIMSTEAPGLFFKMLEAFTKTWRGPSVKKHPKVRCCYFTTPFNPDRRFFNITIEARFFEDGEGMLTIYTSGHEGTRDRLYRQTWTNAGNWNNRTPSNGFTILMPGDQDTYCFTYERSDTIGIIPVFALDGLFEPIHGIAEDEKPLNKILKSLNRRSGIKGQIQVREENGNNHGHSFAHYDKKLPERAKRSRKIGKEESAKICLVERPIRSPPGNAARRT